MKRVNYARLFLKDIYFPNSCKHVSDTSMNTFIILVMNKYEYILYLFY